MLDDDDDDCTGGDCYEAAANYMLNNASNPNLRVVHGEVEGQGPLEGVTFGHAWIEDGDTVIDPSNGGNLRMPRADYYALGKIDQLNNTHVYGPQEAMRRMIETELYGPWDLVGKDVRWMNSPQWKEEAEDTIRQAAYLTATNYDDTAYWAAAWDDEDDDDDEPRRRRTALARDPRPELVDTRLPHRLPHLPLDGPLNTHPATERFQEFLDAGLADQDPEEALEEYLSAWNPDDRIHYDELQDYIGDRPSDSYPFPLTPSIPDRGREPYAEVTYPPGYEMDYDDPHPGNHYRAARRIRQANTHLPAHEPTREPIMSRNIQSQADQWPNRIAKPALIPGRDTSLPPHPDDWLVEGDADPEGKQQALMPQPKKQALPKDPKPEPLPEQLGLFPRPAGPYDAGTQSPFSTGGMDGYNWSDSLVQDHMYQSMIDKYNAADPEIREWGTEWYDNANKYIQNLAEKTGRTMEQVAGVVSAFSPRTAWDPANLTQATHFLLNYDPKNPDAMDKNWPGLQENLKRAKRIADTEGDYDSVYEALQGAGKDAPKITSFYKNMLGDEDAVTMDTWMARAIFGHGQDMFDGDASQQVLGWAGAYDHMSNAVRRAAKDLGISPRALQAIVWTQVNPQADYSEMTPERAQDQEEKKQKAWSKRPPGNPQPDYTKGPAWDATDEEGRPYLPPPTYRDAPGYRPPTKGLHLNASAGEDDFGFFL